MTAQSILEKKGYDSNEAASIVYEKLDLRVRQLYKVEGHPVHLWECYCLGDANSKELLIDAESNTTPSHKYEDTETLFDDMTKELERLASMYPEEDPRFKA